MPQLTVQAPRVVTLDRICDALEVLNYAYVVDVYDSHRTIMIAGTLATSYIDLISNVVRVRSVWRGIVPTELQDCLLPLILHHNRESVGPKLSVFSHMDHFHLVGQSNFLASSGLGAQQLEAQLLLALIVIEKFLSRLELEIPWYPPTDPVFFHRDLLPKQLVEHITPGVSDNSITSEVTSAAVAQACQRLHLATVQSGTVFRLTEHPDSGVLRLFGEDTWLSVSTLLEIGRVASTLELFKAINQVNISHALGTVSLLGLRHNPLIRFDYLVSVGEGASPRQLDTQIIAGLVVTQHLRHDFVAALPPH